MIRRPHPEVGTPLRAGLAVCLLVLGLCCWQGAALAGGGSKKAKARTYAGKGDCGGATTDYPVAGTTTFTRTGNTMTVAFKEKALTPNTSYTAQLWYSDETGACVGVIDLGQVMSTKKGALKAKFTTPVQADVSWFFSDLADGVNFVNNDTPAVNLS